MAKFNRQSKLSGSNKTTNFEGAEAYTMDKHTELYTRVLSTLMGEKKFYESGEDSDEKLQNLIREIAKEDPKFIAGLAVLARSKFHLRSVPQVLVSELSKIHRGDGLVSKTVMGTVERPDDMTEILSYLGNHFGKGSKPLSSLPHQIKKGIASAFLKFNEYQLSKYNRKQQVSLKDVLLLCHPKPVDKDQANLWKRLIEDELEVPETWEVTLTQAGQEGRQKKEAWEEILPKMGYMALLRNLRNLIKAEVDPQKYIPVLINPERIRKSKQLPFRFASAYRELGGFGGNIEETYFRIPVVENDFVTPTEVLDAVAQAMEIAVENVPVLDGITLVASDNSGSMQSCLSRRGKVTYKDIANLMGAIVHKKYPKSMVGIFGESWKCLGLSKMNSILANKEKLDSTDVGHSTNTYLVFDWLTKTKTKVDRIIIFSDMQAWDSYGYWGQHKTVQAQYARYCEKVKCDPDIYSIDLTGYGTSDFDPRNPKVRKIAGWSDKIFDYIAASEQDPKIVMKDIYAHAPKIAGGKTSI